MSYFKVLGLKEEPFSTSPDPDFFYESQEHHAALIRLMVSIRLKRGLSIILGDVGTGKTTLSRKFFQRLNIYDNTIFHMILDPGYGTEELFLDSLIRTFKIEIKKTSPSILDFKEAIKDYLFKTAVEEKKTVVLLIDEAQKLNALSLELLRVLLNYETNEYKLLQLVFMGQLELLPRLREMKNLWDRISLKYVLNPLDEQETKELVDFRLKKAGYHSGPAFFTDEAMREIYEHTQGYPRRIAILCHDALTALVIKSTVVVDVNIVRELIAKEVI
ncbi:MAG: AAA family ATPase [Candidatus Omnitrophica bacterium]|nr:AAA family ATPase [Candidatus Omnitrophota bacterium]